MYITESASEQDEANPVFWLAPWAGKVGPYYCACVSPIKKLSCRERVKQLLHFENKVNVITKFKYLQDFTKILWWAVKWGAVKHWKHRLPTNVLIRLWLFDRNFAKLQRIFWNASLLFNSFQGEYRNVLYIILLGRLPSILCLLFITLRFAVLLILEVRRKWFLPTNGNQEVLLVYESHFYMQLFHESHIFFCYSTSFI